MKKGYLIVVGLLLGLILAACSGEGANERPMMGMGMGMGGDSGMQARHHAQVPEPYAGLTSPVTAEDEESFARGAEIFNTNCAVCHGETGMSDNETAAALDPSPPPVAHSSQMLGDDFLYWRISEGGHEFETAMPSWDGTLDEEARWDVINYIRALGAGTAGPGMGAGGQGDQHAEMLDTAVLQAVITSEEAELFTAVHDEMDALTASGDIQRSGGMNDMQEQLLTTLVEQETITAEDADAFRDIHNRLIESGLMQ